MRLVPEVVESAVDHALAMLVEMDARVNGAEHDGIWARWEFGNALLVERAANGGKQLPHGRLDEVCAATGKSEREIRYRIQFAEQHPTKEKVGTAVQTFSSWTQIRDSLTPDTPKDNHRAGGTGENEWYTPAEYVEMAREVMGGIDLDPASSDQAQEQVGARTFYTQGDDGLAHDWSGRVWLNPPYAQPAIQQFVEKLVQEVSAGSVTAAIMLTHNYTDTDWFHTAEFVAEAVCFTRGRIRFVSPSGTLASPTQGQTFFYYGLNRKRFREVFANVGFVR